VDTDVLENQSSVAVCDQEGRGDCSHAVGTSLTPATFTSILRRLPDILVDIRSAASDYKKVLRPGKDRRYKLRLWNGGRRLRGELTRCDGLDRGWRSEFGSLLARIGVEIEDLGLSDALGALMLFLDKSTPKINEAALRSFEPARLVACLEGEAAFEWVVNGVGAHIQDVISAVLAGVQLCEVRGDFKQVDATLKGGCLVPFEFTLPLELRTPQPALAVVVTQGPAVQYWCDDWDWSGARIHQLIAPTHAALLHGRIELRDGRVVYRVLNSWKDAEELLLAAEVLQTVKWKGWFLLSDHAALSEEPGVVRASGSCIAAMPMRPRQAAYHYHQPLG
jgi:hypothetical protein